jgi:hypothetical protein
MRAFGMFLIAFGVIALLIRSVTFFTTETRVGPLGMFAWDVSQPHTLFINPLAGLLAIAIGFVLLTMHRRQLTA